MGSFCTKNVMFQLETFSWNLCVMTLEGDAKFEGVSSALKNDIKNFVNFKSRLLLSNAFKYSNEKGQKSYVS